MPTSETRKPKRKHDPEREQFYAGTERMTIKRIQCCKCWHVGQKLECRECGHHICLSCKEPR